MRNFVFTIVVISGLLLGIVLVLLNTTILVNALLPEIINEHVKAFSIEEFRCGSQTSRLPDLLFLYNVKFKVRKGDRLVDVSVKEIAIHEFMDFVKHFETLGMSAKGINVETKGFSAKNGQLQVVIGLKDRVARYAEGAGYIKNFEAGAYSFNKVVGHFKINPVKVEVFNVEGKMYDGDFTGQLTLDYKPHFNFALWSEFKGIQTASVQKIHPGFFKTIRGSLDGSLRVVGGEEVDIFTVIFLARKGLAITPHVFLSMRGAFDEEEEAELKRLAENNAALTVEKGVLHIQNSRDENVMMIFDIEEEINHFLLKGRFPLKWEKGFKEFLFPVIEDQEPAGAS
ncbi:MAG: hypothetical protein AB1650_00540 [Candidatus Omnitrophota bacterium]